MIAISQEWIAATVPFFYFVPHIFQVSWLHDMATSFDDVRAKTRTADSFLYVNQLDQMTIIVRATGWT